MADKNKSVSNKKDYETQPELARELTLFQLIMMGAGMMIGAGVFVATGISIGLAGSGGILIAFALNGVIAICSAMSFAELSSALPAAGGAYSYVRQAFGGFIGYISGWMNWFALSVAGSLYAITFSTYTLHVIKDTAFFMSLNIELELAQKLLAVTIALLFIMINYRGISDTGNSGAIIALGQTVTLGIIGVIGICVALRDPERLTNFSPFFTGSGKVLVAMGLTYVGFEGFEVIGHAGEEAIDPKRNIPKAILYSVIIVVTTYLLVAFAAVVGAKPEGMSVTQWFAQRGATGFADAIKDLFPFGGLLVMLAAIFSSTSALNATIFSSARVSFAMGRDGLLPKSLSSISQKRRVPHVALFFSSIIIVVVAALLPVEDVAASADIMFLLIFMLINLSVIKIRREMGDELEYGYLMPFFPVMPIIALTSQLLLAFWLFHLSRMAWLTTIIWLAMGLVMFFLYSNKASKPAPVSIVAEERKAFSFTDYQIMVPIGSASNKKLLGEYAQRIAEARNGELILMSAVTVADQTPLNAANTFVDEKRRLIDDILATMTTAQPLHRLIVYCHNAARSIIGTAQEKDVELIIMGWKGYNREQNFEMGKTIDRVIEGAACDVMVIKSSEKNKPIQEIKRILIPSTGGVHSGLAADIALDLVKDNANARITVLYIQTPKCRNASAVEHRLHHISSRFGDDRAETKIIQGEDVVAAIAQEAKDYDLVIVGATEEPVLKQWVFGHVSKRIAQKCECTVILTKKYLGVRSWLKRWIAKRDCR